MSHKDQVDMIIEELSDNIEWVWVHNTYWPRHPESDLPMCHLVQIETLYDTQQMMQLKTACKNKDIELKELDTLTCVIKSTHSYASLQLSKTCPKCVQLVKDNPFMYSGFKIYHMDKYYIRLFEL